MQIKKWYFACNARALKRCFYQIEIAVRSSAQNTPLTANCLYVGEDIPELERLAELGVTIIRHESFLSEELRFGYGDHYNTFSGHWLRADLPLIEKEEEVILYTDIDVMFRKWPSDLSEPTFIAAAPEMNMDDREKFNSGVMLMNLVALRSVHEEFMAEIRARLLNNFTYPGHDQTSFNHFFSGKHDHLDIRMNWKPYWGQNDDAFIVHFHGPKPHDILRFQNGDERNVKKSYVTLWNRNVSGYGRYVEEARRYATFS